MKYITQKDSISTEDKPICYLCGSHGKVLYRDCEDRLFGAPGRWTLKQCPNADCGLLWLDPMPTKKDIGKAYRNYYTHKDENVQAPKKRNSVFKQIKRAFLLAQHDGYLALRYQAMNQASVLEKLAGLIVHLQPLRKAAFDFKAMYLRCKSGGRLLEIGCGNGDQLEFLQKLGWQVEGLDLDPVAVAAVATRGLTVHVGSLESQRFPDRQFDAIVSSHVIEHVHDPIDLLRECRRVLSLDGRLVVITPNTESWGHRWFRASWLNLDPPRHLHLFNPVSLRRAAEEAGLIVCHLTSTIRDADGLFRASRDIQHTRRHVWGSHHSWIVYHWSKAMQRVEWLLLQAGSDRGEELMMICEPGGKTP